MFAFVIAAAVSSSRRKCFRIVFGSMPLFPKQRAIVSCGTPCDAILRTVFRSASVGSYFGRPHGTSFFIRGNNSTRLPVLLPLVALRIVLASTPVLPKQAAIVSCGTLCNAILGTVFRSTSVGSYSGRPPGISFLYAGITQRASLCFFLWLPWISSRLKDLTRSKVELSPSNLADFPVRRCQRCTTTSTYLGSNSSP